VRSCSLTLALAPLHSRLAQLCFVASPSCNRSVPTRSPCVLAEVPLPTRLLLTTPRRLDVVLVVEVVGASLDVRALGRTHQLALLPRLPEVRHSKRTATARAGGKLTRGSIDDVSIPSVPSCRRVRKACLLFFPLLHARMLTVCLGAICSASTPLSILGLPDADLILRCPVCSYQMKFTGDGASYEKLSISTKYSTASSLAEDEPAQVPAFTRAKVKERCPQCNNPEMSFYTVSRQRGCAAAPSAAR
jgi:DNA-directed RNA polymerase subunit M/transcription elongation factor TFIIS